MEEEKRVHYVRNSIDCRNLDRQDVNDENSIYHVIVRSMMNQLNIDEILDIAEYNRDAREERHY
jgi:hypothetical protein